MRKWQTTAWAIAFAAGLVALVTACGGGSTQGASAHGIVTSVEADARIITIDHEEIPGLMGAMTMTFQVAPGVVLNDVQPGAEVDFRLKEEGGIYTVTEIRPTGS